MSFAMLAIRVGWFALLSTPAAAPLDPSTKDEVLSAVGRIVTEKAFVPGVDFSRWPEHLNRYHAAIAESADDSAFAREVNAALGEFGISHLIVKTPESTRKRKATSALGLGAFVRKIGRGLKVTAVARDGVAANCGLEAGDVIVEVNGLTAATADLLDGDEDTPLALEVQKTDGQIERFSVLRRPYSLARPASLSWVDEEAAVLKVPTFAPGYDRNEVESLMAEAAAAHYLLIDVRSNGGGGQATAVHLLGLLLPEGTPIGMNVTRAAAERYAASTGEDPRDAVAIAAAASQRLRTSARPLPPFTGVVAVLMNSASGSSSEIVAASLSEHAGALLVGNWSAGRLLASQYADLPHGFELQFPTADFVTDGGARIEGHPLRPDVEVRDSGEDSLAPIKHALEALRGSPAPPADNLPSETPLISDSGNDSTNGP